MNYCLIGTDKFRIIARINEITNKLSEEFGSLRQVKIPANINLPDLSEYMDSQSLWGEQKIIIAEGLLSNKDHNISSFIESWLQQNSLSTKLILIEETKPVKIFFQGLTDNAAVHIEHYSPLTNMELRQWAQQYLKTNNMLLDNQTLTWLLANFGNDLWRLANELKKLQFLYPNQPISLVMAKEVVVPVLSDNMFATIDALARRNLILANKLVNTQLTTGTSEAELIALIAHQFRNIALIKVLSSQKISQAEIAERAEIHPYVVKKSTQFMRDFNWTQLQRIMAVIQKIDQAIKRSQIPPRTGLDILVAQIIKS